MNQRLSKRIDKFLNEKRKSTQGGWADVKPNDLSELEGIVQDLIKSKFQPDSDGSYPVETIFVNRQTHERMHYQPVPYSHKDPTGAADTALFNLKISTQSSNHIQRIIDQAKKAS